MTKRTAPGRSPDPPTPPYAWTPTDTDHKAQRWSFHLPARDGVGMAIDLWLPPMSPGEKIPAAVRTTRYWRATVGDDVSELKTAAEVNRWTSQGFALVLGDVRGTGASFGTWDRPWDDAQRDDLIDLADWIVAQPWSSGAIGGFGTSYDGSTAHLLASTRHPAVRAIVPRFALTDTYHQIACPGGVPLDWFLAGWSAANWIRDGHPDRAHVAVPSVGEVRGVDGDDDGRLMSRAREDHAGNWDLWPSARQARSRGDLVGADGVRVDDGTVIGRIDDLRAAEVPMWVWTSWFDGAYAAAALAQLADPGLDCRATIGPWAHGAGLAVQGSPFAPLAPIEPDPPTQAALMGAFVAHHCGDGDVADPSPSYLRYYTIGAEAWNETDVWPPGGVQHEDWWLAGDGSGVEEPPADGHVVYPVDFAATSGTATRWHTLNGGGMVDYGDRRTSVGRRASWLLPPFQSDVEITGTPSVSLSVRSSASDAAVFVYLESESPQGVRTYLTEGQMRLCHRALGEGPPPFETHGPWHTYEEADLAAPVGPADVVPLSFTLWPISAIVRAGHRLRIEIAGADNGVFRRIPSDGDVTFTFHVGEGGCRLNLPLIR